MRDSNGISTRQKRKGVSESGEEPAGGHKKPEVCQESKQERENLLSSKTVRQILCVSERRRAGEHQRAAGETEGRSAEAGDSKPNSARHRAREEGAGRAAVCMCASVCLSLQ